MSSQPGMLLTRICCQGGFVVLAREIATMTSRQGVRRALTLTENTSMNEYNWPIPHFDVFIHRGTPALAGRMQNQQDVCSWNRRTTRVWLVDRGLLSYTGVYYYRTTYCPVFSLCQGTGYVSLC